MVDIIYISPHFDDVCFSLSNIASGLEKGDLINIFTRSAYVKPHVLGKLLRAKNLADTVSEIRDAEDSLFAQKLNLSRTNLNLDDAGLNGDPFDLSNIQEDEKKIQENLGQPPFRSPGLIGTGL